MRRVRGRLAYNGGRFHGFAANEGVVTVAGVLTDALDRVLDAPIDLVCAGRTDRGVHAVGQVVSFDVADDVDLDDVKRSVNRMCGPEIALLELVPAGPGFDARFSATSRTYRYRILNRAEPDPFLAPTAWHVVQPLDVEAMDQAAQEFVGEHDFASFCRRPDPLPDGRPRSLVRRVDIAEWVEDETGGPVIDFWISASSFCHQMVRSITGTLVDIGRGRREPTSIPAIIRAGDRRQAGQLAPPHGLTLWSVGY